MNTSIPSRKERALELLRANRLEEAKVLCEEVCRTENQPGAWYLLGIIHGRLGDLAQAESSYRKAIEIKPDYADAHSGLGIVLNKLGQPENAAVALRRAAHLKPADPEAHFYLGVVLAGSGQLDSGILSFQEAIRLAPGYSAAHVAMGNAQVEQGRFEGAIASYRHALEINPGDIESMVNLGNALSELGRTEEAIATFRQAIDRDPQFLGAYHNLGHALLDLGRIAEAIDVYRIALRTDPDHPVVLADLGVALALQNNHDEATACYLRVLEINPEDAETHYNLGNTLRATGKPEKAIESYRAAIRLRPADADAHVNLGLVYLSLGNFRDGWEEYDWQWRREDAPVRPFPPTPWDGTDLGGKDVFLHAEQGLGDELFFLRFVPWLRRKGAGRIVYHASPKIASLLTRTPIIDEALAAETRPAEGALVLSVGDLPRLLGMERVDQVPPVVTLTPLPAEVEALRRHLTTLGPPPYLGITWRGGTTKKNALYKEIPLAKLATGFRNTHATMVILQRNPLPHEVEAFSQTLGRPVHDFSVLNENLEQMLALLAVIDDYVGVSNANMHLRAAVGRTARVLVPAPPEWRWMAEGRESPWFPGFAVYRQGYDGNWGEAFVQLANDLSKTAHQISHSISSAGKWDKPTGKAVQNSDVGIGLQLDTATSLNNLANNKLFRGETEEAITLYKRATETDPSYPQPYIGMAIAATISGKLEQALLHVQKSLQLRPNDDNARIVFAAIELLQRSRNSRNKGIAPALETNQTPRDTPSTTNFSIVFFHIDAPTSGDNNVLYHEMARMMLATAKAHMPYCTTVMLTDATTTPPAGTDSVVRTTFAVSDELMLVNVALQRAYLNKLQDNAHVVFVDTDLLIRGDLAPVFDKMAASNCDIGLTWRHDLIMPYNYGVIFVRNTRRARNFFAELERRIQLLAVDFKQWYGNQIALATMVEHGFHVPQQQFAVANCPIDDLRLLLLPCEQYNFSPNLVEEVTNDKHVLHFKGDRKSLMREIYRAMHLDPRSETEQD